MKAPLLTKLFVAASLASVLLSSPAPADMGDCGQPVSAGAIPTATDALAVLTDAVGLTTSCDPEPCICDVNGDTNVTSSDALQVLRAAVGQPVALDCDCDPAQCVTLGDLSADPTSATPKPSIDVRPRQVMIEAKFIGFNYDSLDELGFDSQLSMMAPVTIDDGPAIGGTNGDGRTLAVDSEATGGPAGVQYLLYSNHEADGALPILNTNFMSPFGAVKSFVLLPELCAIFNETALSEPQGFPGTTPVQNLEPVDVGLGGSNILYGVLGDNALDLQLSAIQADSRNTILTAPNLTLYDGQNGLHMVDDVEIPISQVDPDIRANIQAVTLDPFANFTGVALDIVPTITDDERIRLDVRPLSDIVSFYFSIAFDVDGNPTDAEIPVVRPSRAMTSIVLQDGETAVLGGLLREGQTAAEKGLPFISDIPVIGTLFSHRRLDPNTQTLVIMVTARLVAPVN